MRTLVLGAGRVGQAIARDLAADPGFPVTVADRSEAALAAVAAVSPVATRQADLGDPAQIHALAAEHDFVVGALPSFLGFAALRAVIEAGRSVADISFFAEDPFALDELARSRGVTAVVDCGVAPGCDNLILGRLAEEMDRIERFVCYVGGLPRDRHLPWEYKAPFAPYDVLNEYLRPARWVDHGDVVVTPPLTDLEHLDFPGVGTLEAFLTDGLRSLLHTVKVPHMKEKTLRYPGHAEKITLLKESGFLSEEPVQVGGATLTPLAMTSKLLFPHWELGPDEDELTALRVIVEGVQGGVPRRSTWDLLDRRDPLTGLSSMARTTGFTCAAVARLVASGAWTRPGVSAPEHVGRDAESFRRVLADLEARGMKFSVREEG
jgi:lysine 6-dehydrogenase